MLYYVIRQFDVKFPRGIFLQRLVQFGYVVVEKMIVKCEMFTDRQKWTNIDDTCLYIPSGKLSYITGKMYIFNLFVFI